jgi:hypothetical protein
VLGAVRDSGVVMLADGHVALVDGGGRAGPIDGRQLRRVVVRDANRLHHPRLLRLQQALPQRGVNGGLRLLRVRAGVLATGVMQQREVDRLKAQLREVLLHVAHDHRRVGVAVGGVPEPGGDLRRDVDGGALGRGRLEDGADIGLVVVVPGGVDTDGGVAHHGARLGEPRLETDVGVGAAARTQVDGRHGSAIVKLDGLGDGRRGGTPAWYWCRDGAGSAEKRGERQHDAAGATR